MGDSHFQIPVSMEPEKAKSILSLFIFTLFLTAFFDILVEFTYHKIHPFIQSVVFSIVTDLCNRHHYLIPEHSHHPQEKLHAH